MRGPCDDRRWMRELLRSNDLVRLSFIEALLKDDGIAAVVLDGHTAAIEGSIGALPRRLMVAEEDFAQARRRLVDAQELPEEGRPAAADAILGGRVRLLQPERGYRAAIDPVLLAAAVPAASGERAAELGSGTGAAALCLAARVPGASVIGIERQADFVALARASARASALADRVEFVHGDIADAPTRLGREAFAQVFANPPYRSAAEAYPPPDAELAAAVIEEADGLARWIDVMLALARPGGALVLIHLAERLDELLAALSGRAGAAVVFPLWPKPGRPAKRVLVRAQKGRRGRLTLAPGLVLHRADGSYTDAAEAVLRGGAPLAL